jgi:hypothetical protein
MSAHEDGLKSSLVPIIKDHVVNSVMKKEKEK